MVRVVALKLHYFVPMFYYSLATTATAPVAYAVTLALGHQPTVLTYEQWIRLIGKQTRNV